MAKACIVQPYTTKCSSTARYTTDGSTAQNVVQKSDLLLTSIHTRNWANISHMRDMLRTIRHASVRAAMASTSSARSPSSRACAWKDGGPSPLPDRASESHEVASLPRTWRRSRRRPPQPNLMPRPSGASRHGLCGAAAGKVYQRVPAGARRNALWLKVGCRSAFAGGIRRGVCPQRVPERPVRNALEGLALWSAGLGPLRRVLGGRGGSQQDRTCARSRHCSGRGLVAEAIESAWRPI
eukprot:1360137-Pyramimonas_sp.AAC.1